MALRTMYERRPLALEPGVALAREKKEEVMTFPHTTHRWINLAERGALRVVMSALGFVLIVIGMALGVSMVMLPAGVVIGLAGVGLLLWGTLGDLPLDS